MKNIKPYRVRNMIIKKLEESDDHQNLDVTDEEEYGYLIVSVYNNDVNKPIENAEVRVSRLTISGLYKEKGEGKLIASVKTGANGYAPLMKLPALNRLQKTADENIISIYILAVDAEGYHNAYVFEIQIYPNITTSYTINLRQIVEGQDPLSEYDFIIEPPIPGQL